MIGGWEKGHGVRKLDGSDYAYLRDKITAMPTARTCDDGTILVPATQTVADFDSEDKPNLPPKSRLKIKLTGFEKVSRMKILAGSSSRHSPTSTKRRNPILIAVLPKQRGRNRD